jgi:hypothetical protein
MTSPVTSENNKEVYVERDYYCRECKNTANGLTIPLDWIVVRRTLTMNEGPRTIGIYCTMECAILGMTKRLFRRA